LLVNDQNDHEDVFRFDRETGDLLLVSIRRDSTLSGDADSYSPVISADGTVVAFTSAAGNLKDQDNNGNTDVFVRDLTTGVTTLISLNRFGNDGGNDNSFRPHLSADGRFVAFESNATDLVPQSDANGDSRDVFVHNRTTGVTALVTVNQAGTATGDRASVLGGISADGRVVVFESNARDLTTNDTSPIRDVFARNLTAGVTTLISVNQAGTGGGNADSFGPAVSADGTIVAFASAASDLVVSDQNSENDIFVRNLAADDTELVSIRQDAADSGSGNSFGLKLSADGRIVAFISTADDLVAEDGNGNTDVFVRDRVAGITTLVSASRDGSGGANGRSDGVALSADGRVAAFVSTADDLTTNAVDGLPNLFVRALPNGLTQLASVNQAGGASGNDPAVFYEPALSADGRVVSFRSTSANLSDQNVKDSGLFLFNVSGVEANTPPGTNDLVLHFSFQEQTLELSYQANEFIAVQFSTDLTNWLPLSELPNVSIISEVIEAIRTDRLQLEGGFHPVLFFRLVQSQP